MYNILENLFAWVYTVFLVVFCDAFVYENILMFSYKNSLYIDKRMFSKAKPERAGSWN